MIAELYSASVSNPGFNWVCSPACTELEQVTIDWMADILGLAPAFHHRHKAGGGGVILNSASEAALTAAIAARGQLEEREGQAQAQGQEQEQGRKGRKGDLVMYGSTQTHSLGAKAALILGVQFRAIEVDGDYRLKGERFERAVEEDLAAGLVPFFVSMSIPSIIAASLPLSLSRPQSPDSSTVSHVAPPCPVLTIQSQQSEPPRLAPSTA